MATLGAAKVIAESGNPESFGLHGQLDETGFYAPVMANPRTEMHRLEELVRLHRMGTGAREVARLLGISPTTERAYRQSLEASDLLEGSPSALPSLALLKTAVQKHRPERSSPAHEISSIAEWEATVGKGPVVGAVFAQSRGSTKRC